METPSPQSRVLELLACKSETKTFLSEVGSLLEECIPNSHAWILKGGNHNEPVKTLYASPRYPSGGSGGECSSPLANDLYSLLTKLGPQREIAQVQKHSLRPEIEAIFDKQIPVALLSINIRPTNSVPWGALCITVTANHVEASDPAASMADARLWMQFAATIIERRLLEERLQTMETRLDLATQAGGIGIFDWDVTSGKVYWSPQQFEIYQESPSTFIPSYEGWRTKVFPEDLEVLDKMLRLTFERRDRYFKTEHRQRGSQGETRWVRSLGEVIYNTHGTPLRLVGTAQDITKEVQAQKQITQERRRLELALEAGELGIWDWNVVTGEIQFGGRWAQILGYDVGEIAPTVEAWEELIHPDDATMVYQAVQMHLDGIDPLYETEHRLRHKNGSWVWVLDRGRVIERDAEGKALRVIGIHSNITAQREARDRLHQEDRRKDEFLATLAHELRNPLAPIRTGLEIIKRNPSSADASQSLKIMERQLSLMVRLIDDLLDISRITLGRLKLRRTDVSVQGIVEMALESSKPFIDAGHHTLSVTLPPMETIIHCDPTRLSQTISNLLVNSAKYTPPGGKICITVQVADSGIEISVSDTGLGIPSELHEEVFKIFGQVNRTLDRSQGGLGIGLALVRNLVTLHGGTVRVESAGIGKGSTFIIALPASVLRTRVAGTSPAGDSITEAPHRKVLIVDDNVDAAESLSMLAKLMGHSAEVASSGHEALQKMEWFHPEVVFLDIGLPGMNGFEVAKAIKGCHDAPIPYVVALTGWGSEETRREAHAAGFDEHLTKPIEIERVERILAER